MSMNCISWDIEAGINNPNLKASVLFSQCIGKTIEKVEVQTQVINKDPMSREELEEEKEVVKSIILWMSGGVGICIEPWYDYYHVSLVNKKFEVCTIPFGELKEGLFNYEEFIL